MVGIRGFFDRLESVRLHGWKVNAGGRNIDCLKITQQWRAF